MEGINILSKDIQSFEYDEKHKLLFGSVILVPVEDQIVYDTQGNEVTINLKFAKKMIDAYNKNRKGLFSIGNTKDASLCVEHVADVTNVVGKLRNDLRLSLVKIDNKMLNCVVGDFIVHEEDIINDLLEKGRDSDYSRVSIGLNLSSFKLDELTLTARPALEHALMLSDDIQAKAINLSKEKQQEVIKLSNEIQQLNYSIMDNEYKILQLKKDKEIKDKLSSVLDHAFSQNQITKQQYSQMLNLNITSIEGVNNLKNVLKLLPKNILNLSSRFKNK